MYYLLLPIIHPRCRISGWLIDAYAYINKSELTNFVFYSLILYESIQVKRYSDFFR